jgi:hypothetical protein
MEERRREPGMKGANENAQIPPPNANATLKMPTTKTPTDRDVFLYVYGENAAKNSESNASVPLETPENAEEGKYSLARYAVW